MPRFLAVANDPKLSEEQKPRCLLTEYHQRIEDYRKENAAMWANVEAAIAKLRDEQANARHSRVNEAALQAAASGAESNAA